MKKIFAALVLFTFSLAGFGQTKKEWLEYGDASFKNTDYASAIYYYSQIFKDASTESKDYVFPYSIQVYNKPMKDTTKADTAKAKQVKPDSAKVVKADTAKKDTASSDFRFQYVTHQLAESYRLNHDYENAETWYRKSILNKSNMWADQEYWFAQVLMSNGKYKEAQAVLEAYIAKLTDTESYPYKRANTALDACGFATDSSNYKKNVVVTLMDTTFNSGSANFAATWFGDSLGLCISSARKSSTVVNPKTQNPNYISDLYQVQYFNGKWWSPRNLGKPVNTDANEAAGVLSPDKTHFYFTRWRSPGKEDAAIYVSKLMNGNWLAPQRMNDNVNAPGSRNMHPAISADGTTIYFSSDRAGGQGKFDIWYCPIDESGNAGKAVNMGAPINTPEDEVTPFYHNKTKSLFYSSNGLGGYGGLDVFHSRFREEDYKWSDPENLGAPVNSSRDDAYYILDKDQVSGYFSSDRELCKSCAGEEGSTQFCYKIYSYLKKQPVFSVHGHVYDKDTKQPIASSLVSIKDIQGDISPVFVTTDENGYYSSPLVGNIDYFMKAQKNKYFADASSAVSTKGLTESKDFEQDFYLSLIPSGEITIPGIEYDFDKTTLRPISKQILDKLYDFLVLNSNIYVEINSHTDTRGSDAYNERLSQGRAKSCVDYLIEKGIARERMIPIGYGEKKPLITDADIAKMATEEEKEAAHQKNRRTTFRVVREEEIKKPK